MFDVVQYWFAEIMWSIGWGYIPERDAAPYILPIVDRNDNDVPDHLEQPETITADAYPDRWDGVNGSPDYTDWEYSSDGVVWAKKEYRGVEYQFEPDGKVIPTVGNSKRRKAYMTVRPLVCRGLSIAQIAAATNMSTTWSERYAGDVRRALKMRYDSDNPTPTLSGGGGAETLEFT